MSVVKQVWHVLALPCREATELISRSMDGPLAWHLRLAVWVHRQYCSACRRYRRQLLAMRVTLRRIAEGAGDAGAMPQAMLSAESRERMRQALRDA